MSAGKKGLKKMAAHVGPNMTPMVDIVMCILIFFMLGSTFLNPEVFLTSNMVVGEKGLGSEKKTVDMPAVRVEVVMKEQTDGSTIVKADNAQFTNWLQVGRPDSASDDKRAEQSAYNDAIAGELRKLHDAGLSDDALVILRPRGQVPYEDVIKVYDACMRARFAKVAFGPATN